MADLAELQRVVERDLGSKDARKLEQAILDVAQQLEPREQVMHVVTGSWFHNRRCMLVATSRQIVVADGSRVDTIPFDKLTDVEFTESWRKASLLLRGPGTAAEVKDMHLDRGREINQLIRGARMAAQAR